MSSLGEFGAAMRELDPASPRDTFTFFGREYTVVGKIPAMLMLQLGAAATGKIREDELLAAMWEALRLSLDEPDREPADGKAADDEVADGKAADGKQSKQPKPVQQFNAFYKQAVETGCDLEPLMRLTMTLFEAQDGRPTDAVPGSGPGPQRTSPSSNGSSSARALPGMTPLSEVLAG